MAKFTAVFNTSPLIFLAKLEYIDAALSLFNKCYAPDIVIKEITEKNDDGKGQTKYLKRRQVFITRSSPCIFV